MCPEHEILSAYCDGEVPLPWNEKIEKHLTICKKCSQKLGSYKTIRTHLLKDSEPDISPSMQRVWNKISFFKHNIRKMKTPFWKKKISLPVPFVAVAATLLVIIGFILIINVIQPNSSTVNIVTQKEDGSMTKVNIIAKDAEEIEALLKAFENDSTPNEVIIQLPEGSNEFQVGEPKLIRVMNNKRKGQ